MRYKPLFILLVGIIAIPVLAYGQATITVGDLTLAPGGTGTIDITVDGVPAPGVTDVQGTLTYDGSVIHITGIEGQSGLTVLAQSSDDAAGSAVFAATAFGSGWVGVTTGSIIRVTVQAVGTAGASCAVNLTLAVFRDKDGNVITHDSPSAGTVAIAASDAPTADFTFTPTNPALGDPVNFTDTSADDGTITAWHWSFGDGAESGDQNPTHSYANGGDFTVTLTVTDNDGLTGSISKTVSVSGPAAAFTFSPVAPTTQDPVQFTDLSTVPSGTTIASWTWNFGDGKTSGDQNPVHTFAEPGTYDVTLRIETSGGTTVSTTHQVVVRNAPPTADFTFTPADPDAGDPVTFNASGSSDPDGQIILYEWDFESDGVYDVVGADTRTVTHTFQTAGSHDVTLRVTDDAGAQAAKKKPVPVGGVAGGPTARFTWNPQNPGIGAAVQFDGTGSTDPDGSIVLWEWDFNGDGATDATGATVVHSFATPGGQAVTLTVTDDDGNKATVTHTVPVAVNPPTATFDFDPKNPKVGEAVSFDASDSNDPDGRIVTYQWDFDDDDVAGDVDATGVKVAHTFQTAGAHKVVLTVTDNDGNARSDTQWVNVDTTPPTAAFTFTPADPHTGQVVSFDASGSKDADGTIILYEWNFGDGSPPATGLAVTHAYDTPGVYPVTLKVTDNDGEFDATTLGVPVGAGGTGEVNQPPVADFDFTPAEGPDVDLNEVVTFKADGCSDPDGTIVYYEWDFDGDGAYDASGETVTHVFTQGGGHIVTLRVWDDDGAPGFKTKVVPVAYVRPVADFTFSPEQPRVGDVVTFDGSPSSDADGSVIFYEWDFDGDGVPDATGMSVTHAFDAGGIIPVTLTVTDNDGLHGLVTKNVPVTIANPTAPVADFTYDPAAPGVDQPVQFTDRSTDEDDNITTWAWDFGDGATSNERNPKHTYAAAGKYTVKLTVTDADGLTSSKSKEITVGGKAKASVTMRGYPNPASTVATIAYTLPDGATDPVLRIYDITGRLVRKEELPAGETTYLWDLRDDAGDPLPNGLYFCIVSAKNAKGSKVFSLLIVR